MEGEIIGKRERKIEAVKEYIHGAAGTWSGYAYGSIPQKLATAACRSYAGAIHPKDIIGLIDITVLNNGKKGMVFTENNIYYDNGVMGNRGSVSYRKIHETGKIPEGVMDSTYNSIAMKELIGILANIEGEDVIQEIGDTIDAGIALIETFAGLFGGGKK